VTYEGGSHRKSLAHEISARRIIDARNSAGEIEHRPARREPIDGARVKPPGARTRAGRFANAEAIRRLARRWQRRPQKSDAGGIGQGAAAPAAACQAGLLKRK